MNRQKCTAFHESGHAVMAYLLHRRMKSVSIVANKKARSAGRVTFLPLMPTGGKIRWLVEREIMLGFAGMFAEYRVTGRHNYGGASSDLKHIIDLARHMAYTVDDLQRLRDRTTNLLGQPAHWRAVKVLAYELLQSNQIGVGKAKKIIQDTIHNDSLRT